MWLTLLLSVAVLLKTSHVTSQPVNRLEIFPNTPIIARAINNSILFTCNPTVVDMTLAEDLQWLDTNGQQIRSDERKYTEVRQKPSGMSLIIKSVQEEDEGTYKCTAKYNREYLEASVTLKTYVDITWVDVPSEQHPIADTSSLIKCKVHSKPKSVISWYKNGQTYAADSNRCTINDDGILCDPIVEADSGNYSCRARVYDTGSASDRSIRVEVYTQPDIRQFNKLYTVKEEESVTLTCNATGNPKPTYDWLDKNNNAIKENDMYEINKVEGTLVISKITRDDAGDIWCVAENKAGKDKEKAEVQVIVKPRITKFENETVKEGDTVNLECIVQAEPKPSVEFLKLENGQTYNLDYDTDYIRVTVEDSNNYDEERTTVEEKVYIFTLNIKGAKRKDDGLYRCVAQNEGGSSNATGHLQVQYKPVFTHPNVPSVLSWMNHSVSIACQTSAIPNATLTWFFNEGEEPLESGPYISINGSSVNSIIEITPVEDAIFGNYTCKAENLVGVNYYDFQLNQATVPGKLLQVAVYQITATTITFKIVGPKDDGGISVTHFVVSYGLSKNEGQQIEEKERRWPVATPYILDGLEPEKRYHFRFAAINQVGTGQWKEGEPQTMPKKGAPEEPEIVSDNGKINNSPFPDKYTLAWKIPQDNGEKILHFEVTYYPVDRENNYKKIGNMETKKIQNPQSTSFTIDGLSPNQHYKLELRANNIIGNSQPGNIIIKTMPDRTSESTVSMAGVPLEVIIGIAVAVLLLVIVIIDVCCYLTNKCGILMFLCVHVCKKQPPIDKVKEATIEEGKAKDSTKTEKEQEANKNSVENDMNSAKDSAV